LTTKKVTKMTYIIKDTYGGYCHSGPRFKSTKPEGGVWTEDKSRAKQFDSAEQAKTWLQDMRAKQLETWPNFKFRMRGFPIKIKTN